MIIVTIIILCVGKTDGSRVLLLCLIFGLHHEEEAAAPGNEDEDSYLDICHDACHDDDNSYIGDEYVHHEEEGAGLGDEDDVLMIRMFVMIFVLK